jgi:hypothetical protein
MMDPVLRENHLAPDVMRYRPGWATVRAKAYWVWTQAEAAPWQLLQVIITQMDSERRDVPWDEGWR